MTTTEAALALGVSAVWVRKECAAGVPGAYLDALGWHLSPASVSALRKRRRSAGRPSVAVDPERDRRAAEMRASGSTLAEIGAALGVTWQRAQRIVARASKHQ